MIYQKTLYLKYTASIKENTFGKDSVQTMYHTKAKSLHLLLRSYNYESG